MTGIDIAIVALLVSTVFLFVKCSTIVPQGMEYTVERLGQHVKTLSAGWHFINPISRIGRKVNMMEQVIDIPFQEVITSDKVLVRVDGVMFYQILDASKAAYQVTNLNRAILNLTMSNIRAMINTTKLDELLLKQDDISSMLLGLVNEATSDWGVKISRIVFKDIVPPEHLVESMTRQMAAERQRRADILEAEGIRKAGILKAEGDKQANILKAEGNKEAAFRDAEARERSAQAEAKATMMLSHAISKGDVNAINYFIAQRYTDALENIGSADNAKVIMVPMDATGLIGSIDGISELTKLVRDSSSKSQ